MSWFSSPASDKVAAAYSRVKALSAYKQRYPLADVSKFTTEVDFDEKNNATADVLYKEGPGSLQRVALSLPKYWSESMKNALGGGFPFQLTLDKNAKLGVPAVEFSETVPRSVGGALDGVQRIYVTRSEFFIANFRPIFSNTRITHNSGAESHRWLAGPNMGYWPQ